MSPWLPHMGRRIFCGYNDFFFVQRNNTLAKKARHCTMSLGLIYCVAEWIVNTAATTIMYLTFKDVLKQKKLFNCYPVQNI